MARRALQEINAGSMADIAFLLLVFFLVTTTMDRDTGLLRLLPPKLDEEVKPPIIREKDVFVVLANSNDQLLVEGNLLPIGELRESTKNFMTNPNNSPDLPERVMVKRAEVEAFVASAKAKLKANPEDREAKKSLKKWERKLQTIELIGEYKELPPLAVISLQNDRGTSYELYVQVHNELAAAIVDLRNEFCEENFGMLYEDMDKKDPEQATWINAAKQVYPQRISEAEPKQPGAAAPGGG